MTNIGNPTRPRQEGSCRAAGKELTSDGWKHLPFVVPDRISGCPAGNREKKTHNL